MKRLSTSFLPPFTLDPKTKMPMYRHLYDWFRHAITSNHLYTAAIVPFASLLFLACTLP
jgi:hypothetical protein